MMKLIENYIQNCTSNNKRNKSNIKIFTILNILIESADLNVLRSDVSFIVYI